MHLLALLLSFTAYQSLACEVRGLRRFWEILPRERMWPRLARSLGGDQEVADYVQNYYRPFADWQQAARNEQYTVDQLRQGAKAMVDVLNESLGAFNLTQTDFEARQASRFKAAIEAAIQPIQGTKAASLQPIFRPAALRVFLFQRLDDMLVTSDDWEAFRRQHKRFVEAVKGMGRRLDRLKEDQLRGLVPLTWDLAEMQQRVQRLFSKLRATPKSNGKDRRRLIKGIRKLGSASEAAISLTATPAYLLLAAMAANLLL